MKAKKMIVVLVLMLATIGSIMCVNKDKKEKKVVVVTVYPIYDITKKIVGNKMQVVSVMPPNADMHTFEPNPSIIKYIEDADILITTGIFSESWEKDIYMTFLKNKGKNKIVINASKGIEIIEGNVHFWVSVKNAIIIAENIKNGIVELDPENSEYYEKNAKIYIEKLINLNREYEEALKNCKIREIIVTHPAYEYLARDYNFSQISIYGASPEVEPSPQKLRSIIERAKKKGIKYVLYESNFDKKIAETVAREIDAEILEINPAIYGEYISVMRKNLEILKVAMECSQ